MAKRETVVALPPSEVDAVLSKLDGAAGLICRLAYLTGLRMTEVLRLRVRDIDLGANRIAARDEQGELLRRAILPRAAKRELRMQLDRVRRLHREEVSEGYGYVGAPEATGRRASRLSRAWEWQFVFPAAKRWREYRSGRQGRHHMQAPALRGEFAAAASAAGVDDRASPSCLRHSLAVHLLADGYAEEAVQKRLGLTSKRMMRQYRRLLDERPDLGRPRGPPGGP